MTVSGRGATARRNCRVSLPSRRFRSYLRQFIYKSISYVPRQRVIWAAPRIACRIWQAPKSTRCTVLHQILWRPRIWLLGYCTAVRGGNSSFSGW